MKWKNESRYEVAVYWPIEREYGGVTVCSSQDKAVAVREELVRLGYKNVHIRRVTIRAVFTD